MLPADRVPIEMLLEASRYECVESLVFSEITKKEEHLADYAEKLFPLTYDQLEKLSALPQPVPAFNGYQWIVILRSEVAHWKPSKPIFMITLHVYRRGGVFLPNEDNYIPQGVVHPVLYLEKLLEKVWKILEFPTDVALESKEAFQKCLDDAVERSAINDPSVVLDFFKIVFKFGWNGIPTPELGSFEMEFDMD